jgi:glucoamylase
MSEIRALPACIRGLALARAAVVALAALLLGVVLVSGGFDDDPATPPALPGEPPPFLGTAVTGYGGLTAAVDAYGDVVDLRPTPAGEPLIDNSAARQAAGTVPPDTGIVPRVSFDGGAAEGLWNADSVSQRYEPGTNVVLTVARFGQTRIRVRTATDAISLAMTVAARGPGSDRARPELDANVGSGARCRSSRRADDDLELLCGVNRVPAGPLGVTFEFSIAAARTRLAAARSLGPGAPPWARAMYRRSLLTLFALTDRETGAVAAGARDGWAYVWPRDAATAALAYAAAGLDREARKVARFLRGLPLEAAARFTGRGAPVPGRGPQGDAAGWIAVASRAAGLPAPEPPAPGAWRDRPDYQEGSDGTYLGNALAASAARYQGVDGPISGHMDTKSAHRPPGYLGAFVTPRGLVRSAGDPGSGLDSAAAWAVRPFGVRALYPAARRTLLRLLRQGTRFGITPGEGWSGGDDPWSAPTAAAAWALAALGGRAAALHALGDLRRAATPAGDLPERVDATTGVPRSTTPLAWSHAFTVLALRELWP